MLRHENSKTHKVTDTSVGYWTELLRIEFGSRATSSRHASAHQFHRGATKKSVEPRLLPEPRPRGIQEQHMADAPCGARLKMLLLGYKSLAAQVGRFQGSRNLTLARRLIVSCGFSARRLVI